MKLLRFPLILLPLFMSCDIINEDEQVPSFLYIETIDVLEATDESDDEINCGNTTHKITDARVFVNNNLIGLFELPATIPVLDNGETSITVIPGVTNIGIPTDRMDYPFLEPFETTLNLQEDNTEEILPQVSYFTDTDVWQETFDNQGISFQVSDGLGVLNRIDDTTSYSCPYDDDRVASLSTTIDGPIVEIVSTAFFSVDAFGNTFLEFNYKNEETFFIGLKTGTNDSDNNIIVGVNPSYEGNNLVWKKMHIELAPYMRELELAEIGSYNLIFKSELSSPESVLLLDNIRVLHR